MQPTARYPRAFALSVILHATIVIALSVFAWWSQRKIEETPQIFELVAGEGNDYAALEAPTTDQAVSTPSVSVDLPEPTPVITPAPVPETPAPTPAPRIERVPEPKAEKAPPVKKAPPPKERTEVVVAEKAPKPPAKTTTWDQFTKQHGAPKTTKSPAPKTAAIKPKKINAESIAGRVASGSTNNVKEGAGGTAMSRAESDLTEAYVALILQRIRQSMQNAGVNELRETEVEFRVSAAGAISDARIIGSSGSREFDQAVLTAFRSIRPLGPPPSRRAEAFSVTIRMREQG